MGIVAIGNNTLLIHDSSITGIGNLIFFIAVSRYELIVKF